jgi:hypothetical protein
MQSSDPSARRLARIAAVGRALLILGGLLVWLLTPTAWPLILLGALLLCCAPLYVAATAGGVLRRPKPVRKDARAHTFVVDLFRSIDYPPATRDAPKGPDQSTRDGQARP